jgi:hypothetical protein
VPGRAGSLTPLKANAGRSQALYLFVSRHDFLVEPAGLGVFRRIVAAQLVEHFADGKFIYFSHRNLLCAARGKVYWTIDSKKRICRVGKGALCAVPTGGVKTADYADRSWWARRKSAFAHPTESGEDRVVI